ncbi:DRTGG domain-containing protein [Alkalibacter mobilis]|uniref:DRTGG domain-containing protein n=1 Tax=Alkalibacter mobilis TaxID=2787712 RepID=UPI00189D0D69|nr:DRTGG domain-containing protein [Alkalibacter mobilis]MBF7097831.1 AraC family transcriptional regulator [Alkalibacter mobilis]
MSGLTVKNLLEDQRFILSNSVEELDKQIENVYIGDLLSWVMSHSDSNCAWITVQTHINIVAVAVLLEMSCIILPEGLEPDENTKSKSESEGIPIITTELDAFSIACVLKEKIDK